MKINYKSICLFLFCLSLIPCAWAQVTVVKQDGQKVYLDTSEFNRTVFIGDSFQIILSKEKLTNPTSGKDLGFINHYSQTGKIIEVQPLYAIGEMPGNQTFSIGQEAVIAAQNIQPVPTATTENATKAVPVSTRRTLSYNVLEGEIISAAQADLTAFPGKEIAAVTADGKLILYQAEGVVLQPLTEYKLPVNYKPVSVSVQDLMQNGRAQVFVSAYDENERKMNTFVFEVQDNQFKKIDTLPYFVKQWGCGENQALYAQKPFINGHAPGAAHRLVYQHNRFKLDKKEFATRHNWLSGTQVFPVQNEKTENLIYTSANGRLRMQLKNGKFTESPDLFSGTPNRVKYKQEIVSFYPSIQVYGPYGKATLAAIENTTKMGLLSRQFGMYNGAKMHFLTYENGVLDSREVLPLDGFVYDTSCTENGILVPQVLSSGQTVLKEIYR